MTDELDTLRPEVATALGFIERNLKYGDGTACEGDVEIIRAELLRLQEEEIALSDLVQRQAKILTGVANALKGEPGRLHMHSHHDLAEVAHSTTAELAALKARIAEAEVAELPRDFDTTHPMSAGIYITGGTASALIGKRVRLLVEE